MCLRDQFLVLNVCKNVRHSNGGITFAHDVLKKHEPLFPILPQIDERLGGLSTSKLFLAPPKHIPSLV